MTSQLSTFEKLDQKRAHGDPLSEEELRLWQELSLRLPQARQAAAFQSLQVWLNEADDTDTAALQQAVLSELRQPQRRHLHIVGPKEEISPVATEHRALSPWRKRRGLVALLGAAAALAFWLASGGQAEAPSANLKVKEADSPQLLTTAPRAELTVRSGAVMLKNAASQNTLPTLKKGSIIETGAGRACLAVEPEIEICLAPHSQIRLTQLTRQAIDIRVVAGTAVARLSKRPLGEVFSLSTETLRAVAVGTVFALNAGDAAAHQPAIQLSVLEGTVLVKDTTGAQPKQSLGAHTRLTAAAHKKATHTGTTPTTLTRQEEGAIWALLSDSAWATAKEVGVLKIAEAPVSESTAGPPSEVFVDDSGPFGLPLSLVLPTGRHMLRSAGQPQGTSFNVLAGKETQLNLPQSQGQPQSHAGQDTRNTKQQPSSGVKELLNQAQTSLKQGTTKKALRLYRKLVKQYPSSRQANSVRITVAQLELQNGSPSRALRGFSAYLQAGGALAPEALAGKVRALSALGRRGQARDAMRKYVERYPRQIHAAGFRRELARP